jgi:hypothetical protein
MLTTSTFRWRPMTSAMSRNDTPVSRATLIPRSAIVSHHCHRPCPATAAGDSPADNRQF